MLTFIAIIISQGRHKDLGDAFLSNIFLLSLLVFGVWILIGSIFYTYYDGWTGPTAYYYAMEAGLNVGFCAPVERDDNSRAFTIVYVLLGSSFVAGALALFLVQVTHTNLAILKLAVPGSSVFNAEGKVTLLSLGHYLTLYQAKYWLGCYGLDPLIKSMWCFVLWLSWGVASSMMLEGWDLVTALYWAITSSATSGLISPTCLNHAQDDGHDDGGYYCDMGLLKGALYGIFFMVSVPLMAFVFGQWAALIIAQDAQRIKDQQILQMIEGEEFRYAAVSSTSTSTSTSRRLHEFVWLSLLRLQATSLEEISRFQMTFHRLVGGDSQQHSYLQLQRLRSMGRLQLPPADLNEAGEEAEAEAGNGNEEATRLKAAIAKSQETIRRLYAERDHQALSTPSSSIASSSSPVIPPRILPQQSEDAVNPSYAAALWSIWLSVWHNLYAKTLLITLLWTMVGTVFYHFYNGWTMPTAYYYAIGAGYVIGFCGFEERDDGSRVFTTIYVLFAITWVFGYMGLAMVTLLKQDIPSCRCLGMKEEGGGAVDEAAGGLVPGGADSPSSSPQPLLATDREGSEILVALQLAEETGPEQLPRLQPPADSSLYRRLAAWLPGAWQESEVKMLAVFLLCVLWGYLYGLLYLQYSHLSALYFSLLTMSTGGLLSPPCLGSSTFDNQGHGTTCDVGTVNGIAVGLFGQLGVPIYAATLGMFTGLLMDKAQRAREDYLLSQPIDLQDFLVMANLFSQYGEGGNQNQHRHQQQAAAPLMPLTLPKTQRLMKKAQLLGAEEGEEQIEMVEIMEDDISSSATVSLLPATAAAMTSRSPNADPQMLRLDDYVLFCLLRLGKISLAQLLLIEQKFQAKEQRLQQYAG